MTAVESKINQTEITSSLKDKNKNNKKPGGNSQHTGVPKITVHNINAESMQIRTKEKIEFRTNLIEQNENIKQQEWKIITKRRRNSKISRRGGYNEFNGRDNPDYLYQKFQKQKHWKPKMQEIIFSHLQ